MSNKATDPFKETIKQHLDNFAAQDELFKNKYNNPNKSLDECISYIFQEVQKSGCNGFTDAEVYNMATHYYDETDIKVDKGVTAPRVVVNHKPETPKDQAKAKAPEAEPIAKPIAKKKPNNSSTQQLSMF